MNTSGRATSGGTRRRRWPRLVAVVVVGVGGAVGSSSPGTTAGASGTYQLTSAADGVRITVNAVNAPVTNVPFDLGAPVAQSTLDSLQTSQSLAALPYPGDLVVAAPGTVAGFSGGQVTPPDYPFVVQASHPVTPETTIDQPGYRLHAAAGPSDAISSASSGLRGDSAAAAATVATSEARRTEDGTLRAASGSEVTGFSAGPVTIGAVRSSAEVIAPASGTATKRSGLSLSGLKVGDVAVELTPAGLRLAGSQTPLPPSSAVAQALGSNGIELGYLSPQESDVVVVSPAVAVTVTRSVDGPVSPLRVTYILGRSLARIATAGSTDSVEDVAAVSDPVADGPSPSSPPAGAAAPLATDATAPAGPLPAAIAPRGTAAPVTDSGDRSPDIGVASPQVEGGRSAAEAAAPPAVRPLAGQPVRLAAPEFGTADAYSLLVVAGLVLLAVTQLFRTITNRRAEMRSA